MMKNYGDAWVNVQNLTDPEAKAYFEKVQRMHDYCMTPIPWQRTETDLMWIDEVDAFEVRPMLNLVGKYMIPKLEFADSALWMWMHEGR
jgi:hypothetical protein